MTLVVLLTVRPDAVDAFRAFEHAAARIMAAYGGAIERAVAVPPTESGAPFREVHIVTFPSAAALAVYRADPALRTLAPQRESCVLHTEVLYGEEGPEYGH